MSPPADLESYEYEQIPHAENIRYLLLHPGSTGDPLECTLQTVPLVEANFEAVSYVWGSDVRDQHIICNGRSLALTTNLFRVLRRIRQCDAARSIWADLICINQEDLDEKSHQVAIMGSIYRQASRVLIHMGDDDNNHGQQVASLLSEVCSFTDNILPTLPKRWNEFPFPDHDAHILTDPRWESLRLLLDVAWFTRGWVVRETGLAQDGLVLWGTSEFGWDSLMRTCIWLCKRATTTYYAKGFDKSVPLAHIELYEDRNPNFAKLFTDHTTWVEQSLLGYLTLARELNLKDPRDRIYAFLELVHEDRQVRIQPNYKEPFLLVYQRFAIEYIRCSGSIGLLSGVEHNERSLESEIPSWVPRWDIPLTKNGFAFAPPDSGYQALTSRNKLASKPKVTDEISLKVKGVVIDQVLYASETLDSSTTTTDTISEMWQTIRRLTQESPYPKLHQLRVLLCVLTADTRDGDMMDWLQSFAMFYRTIYEKSGSPDNTEFPGWLSYLAQLGSLDLFSNCMNGYIHNRKVILTRRGYIGLAPGIAQKDDLCAIIFGCTTPCILKKSNKENNFKYLGAAFITGRNCVETPDGRIHFNDILGATESKDWIEWGIEEQDIYLC
ncbi:heterokaryon incompatibility protein-domain-containing protein [Phaeosphaeriaceae sp. PMI808]|nr:heterokaryon incompatibility protein-domain-containing protein [Phaeosphaeriaceae sp. PMI808]